MAAVLAQATTFDLDEIWRSVASFGLNLAGFIAILVVGYFVAKIVERIVDKVLDRLHFDRAVERGGIKRAMANSPYDPSQLMGRIAFYAIMLLALQVGFAVFGPNPISEMISGVVAYIPKILAAIIIVVVGAAIATAVRGLVLASVGGLSYGPLLARLAGAAVLVIAGFAALTQLEIAEPIVVGLFYGMLAVVAGSAIVAIGGGGIGPMRAQWERTMNRMSESPPAGRGTISLSDDQPTAAAGTTAHQTQR